MFDKFGEFDSAEEINSAARAQLEEGDTEAVFAIAQENGIDREDAQDFIDGAVADLATPLMAAAGKIKIESEDLQIEGILKDWKNKVIEICVEDKDVRTAVRKKGKSLRCCMAALVRFAFENKVRVSDRIVDETKVMHNGKLENMRKPLYLGIPNSAQAGEIIKGYYKG